jgi:hypothetical protein
MIDVRRSERHDCTSSLHCIAAAHASSLPKVRVGAGDLELVKIRAANQAPAGPRPWTGRPIHRDGQTPVFECLADCLLGDAAILYRPADSQHFTMRNRERRADRRRRDAELHQLVKLTPMWRSLPGLPVLNLLSRDAKLRAEYALGHPQLGPQIKHIDRSARVLPEPGAQSGGIAALRRAQPLSYRETQARDTPSLPASCARVQLSVSQTRSMSPGRNRCTFAGCLTCYHIAARW